jgi:phosphatidylglycerol:prolipoprotein diacylglycerol transferase
MRPVLLRLLLDHPWQLWEPNVRGVQGTGLALFVFVLGGLWFLWLWLRRRAWTGDDKFHLVVWIAALGLLTIGAPRLVEWLTLRFGDIDPANGKPIPVTSLPIFGYGTMVLLAFVSGTALAQYRARRAGYDPAIIFEATYWTLVCGVLGGRLFYIVQHGDQVFAGAKGVAEHLIAAVNLSRGGLVLIGAMCGAAIGVLALCRYRKLAVWPLLDLLTPSIFLAVGFGRIGCHLYGCCFGDPSTLPWAVTFGPESAAYQTLVERGFVAKGAAACMPLHPTQLYSAFDGFLLALVTYAYTPFRRHPGQVFALGMILYPITRFFIEFVRADELGQLGTGLTISQLLSIGMLVGGLSVAGVIAYTARRKQPTVVR